MINFLKNEIYSSDNPIKLDSIEGALQLFSNNRWLAVSYIYLNSRKSLHESTIQVC